MYIAMNRVRVARGREADFEKVWAERDSRLKGVPGFVAFHLLRGPAQDDHTLYASHSLWESRAAFEGWTRSDAFRRAHRDASDHRGLYLGPPQLETFEVVQSA